MTELKLPEQDTHCLDDEGGRPIDVWSYSPEMVREILAQQQAEIERLRDENSLAIANACAAHDDAERYRYLAPRLLAADFDWNETGKCVLVFDWPSNVGVGGNCDKSVDAAIDAMKGSTP